MPRLLIGSPHYPAAPLLELARLSFDRAELDEAVSDGDMAALLGVSRCAVQKWRMSGRISNLAADRAAVAMGLHPLLIWPDYYNERGKT